MIRLTTPALALVLVVGVTACGSGSRNSSSSIRRADRTNSTSLLSPRTRLLAAVRSAIRIDHQLSVRVLWTNTVPSRPVATAGPSLTILRSSAAARRRRGIRVRLVSEHFRIVSITLDPSFARATAVITDPQRVRPYGADGHPLGRSVSLNERVRLQLRRVGHSNRFVVWAVKAIR